VSARAWVGFRIGSTPLAVEASTVRGVTTARGIIPVPLARRGVCGVIVREGRLVPVFDLGLIPSLWNEAPGPGGEQVIVLSAGETEAGILSSGAATFSADPGGARSAGDGSAGARDQPGEAILSGTIRAMDREYGILKVEAALIAAGVPVG
jgi:chemotaxis signal transduction protein